MSQRHLIRLPNGTLLSHHAIRAVRAQHLSKPFLARDGVASHAAVVIETRNQIIRMFCLTHEDAQRIRDQIGAAVDERFEREAKDRARHDGIGRHMEFPVPAARIGGEMAEEALT